MRERHLRRLVKLRRYLYKNKSSLIVYFFLRGLVILSMARAFVRQDYQSVFLCGLSLILMLLPSILSHKLDIKLPSTLEIFILLFIFAAEILGEINSFYVRVPHWDTMLHTINGFLCAAVGFALVDLLNRNERFSIQLSPLFLAIVAFCFSMTVGVLWEFFEYFVDCLLGLDMQKDTVIHSIASVSLDLSQTNTVIRIGDIQDVILVRGDGSQQLLGLGGYLDPGIHDTMKDLMVNLIGAAAFSLVGYLAAHKKGGKQVRCPVHSPGIAGRGRYYRRIKNRIVLTIRFFVSLQLFPCFIGLIQHKVPSDSLMRCRCKCFPLQNVFL